MDERTVDELVRGLARGLKVFLEALAPTSETLQRLAEAGYDIRVLVAANRRGERTWDPVYLVEVTAAEESGEPYAGDGDSLTAEVEDFLRSLDS